MQALSTENNGFFRISYKNFSGVIQLNFNNISFTKKANLLSNIFFLKISRVNPASFGLWMNKTNDISILKEMNSHEK